METEESLLTGLVDFSDYFAAIRARVGQQTLTDSDLKLTDVYAIGSCIGQVLVQHQKPQQYLLEWLQETSQRQMALLGEYGQGKSTAALMLAYRLIVTGQIDTRRPNTNRTSWKESVPLNPRRINRRMGVPLPD